MSIIQERTEIVQRLIERVKDHCMCLRFEDDGRSFMVIYPEGDFPVHGVRVSYILGKAVALERMLEIIERHWIESFP